MIVLTALLLCLSAEADPDSAAPEVAPVVEVVEPSTPTGELYRLVEVEEETNPRRLYHPVVDLAHTLTFWVNEGERMAAAVIELSVLLAVAISVPVNHLFAILGFRFRILKKPEELDINEEIKLLRIQVVELKHDRAVAQQRVNMLESHLTKASQIGAEQAELLQVLLNGGSSGDHT